MLNKNEISLIRKFNRQYTNTLGLLNKRVFNTELSFPEARVLMSINQGSTPMNIANKLNLDASYTSRIIKKLTKLNYVQKSTSATDARSKNLSLTANGITLLEKIDTDSDVQIQNLIENLSAKKQSELYQAFETINNILFENDGE
ncbi:MarR family winged helix-turn-helix transcriptional regulator [Companilactobacillus jidongensis]|uniref:MarR family winged helix-turn-helix transcriptional regulator n=1 Tax=Companilactobacillus jidongensis TaxID=2486006 RepID=UPI000F78BAD2|nr:winged helix DNA-binding protein [Companilactobacillus jidongensis]